MKIKLLIEKLQELEKSGCANVLIEDSGKYNYGNIHEYNVAAISKESKNAIIWIESAEEE